MIDLLYAACREAAPSHYQHVDRARMEDALDKMGKALAQARMDVACNCSLYRDDQVVYSRRADAWVRR